MGCLLVGENVILSCFLEALSHPLLISAQRISKAVGRFVTSGPFSFLFVSFSSLEITSLLSFFFIIFQLQSLFFWFLIFILCFSIKVLFFFNFILQSQGVTYYFFPLGPYYFNFFFLLALFIKVLVVFYFIIQSKFIVYYFF